MDPMEFWAMTAALEIEEQRREAPLVATMLRTRERWRRFVHQEGSVSVPGCGCFLCVLRDVGAEVDVMLEWGWPGR
jgi:hypothetical protein